MNNEFENNTIDMELEAMRHQMNTLKKKLDQQEIVNDRIIRKSMRNTANNIKRRYYAIMALTLLMIPYTYVVFILNQGLSMAFWIGTSILMLLCCGATYYNSQNVTNRSVMSNNLVEVRQKIARAKKFDANWLIIGIPLMIVFLGWFMYESYLLHSGAFFNGLFWAGCIGGIIGAIWGFSLHFRTQCQYQNIIDQIEDLTAEE